MQKGGIFYGDALGYYAYLPSAFIHNNLTHIQDMADDETIPQEISGGMSRWKGSYGTNEEGNVIIQYTYGVSLLHSPFFVIGHFIQVASKESANGFQKPYILVMRLGSLVFSLLGFFILYQALIIYFEKQLVLFGLISLFIGTNVLWFTVVQAGMSHIPLFFLYSAMILLSIKTLKKPRRLLFMLIGLVLGLITLIRPTDVIAIMIPILWGVNSKEALNTRFLFIKEHLGAILLLALPMFMLPIIPQLYYWKIMTGDWLYYSYTDQGFNWSNPQLLKGLFGASNGWFTYTPLMLLAAIGMVFIKKQNPSYFLNLILVPLYLYIIYSWWCYNYINGFGSRPMIHLYPLLIFSLLALIQWSLNWVRWGLLTIVLLLVGVNLNYTIKALKGQLFTDESTHAYNMATFFKSEIDYKDLILKDTEIPQVELINYKVIESIQVESSPIYDASIGGIRINDTIEYSPFTIKHTLSEEDLKSEYLAVSGQFYAPELVFTHYHHHLLVFNVIRNGESFAWYGIRINNKIGKEGHDEDVQIQTCKVGKWGEVTFTYPLKELAKGDEIKAFIWNPDRKEMWVRMFELRVDVGG